jgi:hypothetical protein
MHREPEHLKVTLASNGTVLQVEDENNAFYCKTRLGTLQLPLNEIGCRYVIDSLFPEASPELRVFVAGLLRSELWRPI